MPPSILVDLVLAWWSRSSRVCHPHLRWIVWRLDSIGELDSLDSQTMIEIIENITIGEDELTFKTSRSSGPGGQNVNKLNTRVTVLFDVGRSPSLSDEQKRRVLSKLSTRMDRQGILRIVSQKHRSQEANRRAAVERLQQLLREALTPAPVRRKTRVPAAARQRRLEEKKQRGLLKSGRARRDWEQ
jgi:ribosome-associated protein